MSEEIVVNFEDSKTGETWVGENGEPVSISLDEKQLRIILENFFDDALKDMVKKYEREPKVILDIYPRQSGKTTKIKEMIDANPDKTILLGCPFNKHEGYQEYDVGPKKRNNLIIENLNIRPDLGSYADKVDMVLVDEPFFVSSRMGKANLRTLTSHPKIYMIGTSNKLFNKRLVELWFSMDQAAKRFLRNEYPDLDEDFREIEASPIGLLSGLDQLRVNKLDKVDLELGALRAYNNTQLKTELYGCLFES